MRDETDQNAVQASLLTCRFEARSGMLYLAPTGVTVPYESVSGLEVDGGRVVSVVPAQGLEQSAVVIAAEGAEVTLRYATGPAVPGFAYPQMAFTPVPNRYTRAATELTADAQEKARQMRAKGGDEAAVCIALAEDARARFAYDHPEKRFNDGHNAVPYLACGMTPGSCVDINTYFIASLRAAGMQAGYIYGYFFPEERDVENDGRIVHHTIDGHCWVVTRHVSADGDVQYLEWDIAHHMKAGLGVVGPALNPRPGRRIAMTHSMGHRYLVDGKYIDLKTLGMPIGVTETAEVVNLDCAISMQGT